MDCERGYPANIKFGLFYMSKLETLNNTKIICLSKNNRITYWLSVNKIE